jgi:hypothetical protein
MGTWERLLSAAFSNELHPKVAEKAARRLGLKPLLPRPTYNPMASPRWGLTEAIAWVAWGNVEISSIFAPEYRRASYHWQELTHRGRTIGWQPTHLSPPTWTDLELAENVYPLGGQPNSFGVVKQAWARLRLALIEERIPSVGVSRRGEVREIPPYLWFYLELSDSAGGVRATFRRHRFDEISLPRDRLQAAFGVALTSDPLPAVREPPRIQQAILQAVATLWPNGPPLGLTAKEKHDLIVDHLRNEHGFRTRPSPVTIRRALGTMRSK